MLTTEQVLKRLSEEGITENIQMVRRWIRQGDLPAKAPAKRKDGYLVAESDLAAFIEKKRKKPKRTAAEYEAEIQQLKEDLERMMAENAQLREELERAEERNTVLTRDLFDALDKLESRQKEGTVNWKRKYDEAIKHGREKTNRLIAAEQEIDILKMKLADPDKYGVLTKPTSAPMEPAFTERFQFQAKKYEARVYTHAGKYVIYLFEGWGRIQKEVQTDKASPLFKRFLEIVRSKHGVSVEMALASWEQLIPANEVNL